MSSGKLVCPNCGNEDRKEMGHLTDTVITRAIWGTVQGRIAVSNGETGDSLSNERIQCFKCTHEWPVGESPLADVNSLCDYSCETIERFEAAKVLEQAGDTHIECFCHEEQLLLQGVAFINYKPLPLPTALIAAAAMKHLESPEIQAVPVIRGWFKDKTQLLLRCPVCDGSMLRKQSKTVLDGSTALENLRNSSPDNFMREVCSYTGCLSPRLIDGKRCALHRVPR